MNENIAKLRKKALSLPEKPGVYIMHNKSGEIIYIGKSKKLKNRVSQYFGSQNKHPEKVKRMISNVYDFEYIITDSEFEALVLECSLIKQHTPKYNILLKDDKGYHYIKITNESWPRITAVNQVLNDGATYIGPYTSSWTVKNCVDEALKIFKLPNCNRNFSFGSYKSRPCLNYYIKQCCAPCSGKIKRADYNEYIKDATEFLQGGNSSSIKILTDKMDNYSKNLDFENAAKIRDRILAIKKINDRQKVVSTKIKEQDVIALVTGENQACFEVFRFSNGKLFDRESFILDSIVAPNIARAEFLQQYYSIRKNIPPRVTLDGDVDSYESLCLWLSKKSGKKVNISIPKKGEQLKLVEMCRNNAAETLAQSIGRTGSETSALDELARLLNLEKTPVYIESYDISNLSGSENVAGMVVFKNGRPFKASYRKFKIKSFLGQDDYESMREVISRRLNEYEKAAVSDEGFGRLPDLILLDGGKGQVSAVESILKLRGYNIPIFGMVKDSKHKTRAIALNGGEISINSNKQAFKLVTLIQNEVHRFAITYHRSKRKSSMLSSSLTQIPGIGPKKAEALLKNFKTISNIKNASIDQLNKISGINLPLARQIYNHFHNIY